MVLLSLLAALPVAGSGAHAVRVVVEAPGMQVEALADGLVLPLADDGAGHLAGELRLADPRLVSLQLVSTELGRRPLYDGLVVLRGEDVLAFAVGPGPRAYRLPHAPSAGVSAASGASATSGASGASGASAASAGLPWARLGLALLTLVALFVPRAAPITPRARPAPESA